jgi:hypothetical protein
MVFEIFYGQFMSTDRERDKVYPINFVVEYNKGHMAYFEVLIYQA